MKIYDMYGLCVWDEHTAVAQKTWKPIIIVRIGF